MKKVLALTFTIVINITGAENTNNPAELAKQIRDKGLDSMMEEATANAALRRYKTNYKYLGPLSEKSAEDLGAILKNAKKRREKLACEMEALKRNVAGTKNEKLVLEYAKALEIFNGLAEATYNIVFVSKM